MIDDGMTSDPEQFVTEIQIPVEGKESTENPKKVEKKGLTSALWSGYSIKAVASGPGKSGKRNRKRKTFS